MPDPPSNSPIDLRAHIRYDKYHRISAEKSYKNYEKLCETMGNEAISIEEYESLYNQYIEEDERELPDIRGCILSDVINGKTAEKSLDDLCDAFKYQKIDKEDHDYWYNRFDSGHRFTRVTFSDFPEDVLAEIVEKCDIISYLNLRNVSYGLRAIADQLPPPCTHIEFDITVFGCPDVFVDGTLIVDSELDVLTKKNSSLQMEAIEIGVLEPLLRNPKLRLKDFEFYSKSGSWLEGAFLYTDAVIKLLNSLDHKFHVKNCAIGVKKPKNLMDILRCFKPGTLERMEIIDGFTLLHIYEIAKLDQWKQAKHLELRLYGDGMPPMEHFLHFSTIEMRSGSISLTDIVNLCDSVSKWTNFEHIQIENYTRLDKEEIKRVLNLQPTASPEVYTIPNSNLFFQFLLNRFGMGSFKIYRN
ncbi:hypothetical protein GCK72_021070 [Caenorhabditis remanei]|uniref:F-box domain-containing protein n=1 Tax=Caenorhabditis remanei TaxID=31234 RepID=A0A6A5GH02_CAERE|nr:hypothetical protein GCK72_021070 [Caenorhabditis remanei]KAF1754507.1 hypothetical protein GCK72_021070 [Caenorhabditis remanei]